jgi:ketosteroid isomerase-like protein
MFSIQVPIFLAGLLGGAVPRAPAPEFAAPRIIMLHGGSLQEPVFLTNWWENLALMGAIGEHAPVRRSSIDTTGSIQVAMFWNGPDWEAYARSPARLPELLRHLDMAQRGALYLPPRTTAPLLDYWSAASDPSVRTISAVGLAILSKAGLPLPGVSDSVLVAAAITAFHSALSTGDSMAALSWLADDVVVLEAGTRETRQEYRDHHLGADIQYARSTRTTRGPIAVRVVGDVAWAESTSENTRTVEGRTTRSSGAELMVLSRTAKGWQIRAIHWSSRTRRAEG